MKFPPTSRSRGRSPLGSPEKNARSPPLTGPATAFLLRSVSAANLPRMSDAEQLTPAKPEDIAEAIAYALQFYARKRTHRADEMMARIVAEQLVEALERAALPRCAATAACRWRGNRVRRARP